MGSLRPGAPSDDRDPAGRPQDAIDLHTRQVSTCRDIGYVRGTMVALEGLGEANVAATRFEAVEILATVLAEPLSAQQPFTHNTPIRDIAAGALKDLHDALSPEEYSAALVRGRSTPFEVATKELMAAWRDHGGSDDEGENTEVRGGVRTIPRVGPVAQPG